jgi:hypothetical protein
VLEEAELLDLALMALTQFSIPLPQLVVDVVVKGLVDTVLLVVLVVEVLEAIPAQLVLVVPLFHPEKVTLVVLAPQTSTGMGWAVEVVLAQLEVPELEQLKVLVEQLAAEEPVELAHLTR